jgi:two-component system chemotaxis sensor kinase CheA
VKAKALEKGLITPEQAARMSARELQNLIFLPGFSTAEKVTNVSGRGVGMDVVKTNIEHIGGAVDVQSAEGSGTTLKIRIPLTLAIVPALTIRVGGERYGIPQVNLLELVRVGGEGASDGARLESIHGAPVFRLRGKLLPVFRLRDLVGVVGAPPPEEEHVVVLQADDRRFGLIVDEVCDTGEIVVKPLSARLKPLGIFAGATIMGDGGVVLILDVMGVAHASRVLVEGRRGEAKSSAAEAAATAGGGATRSWLLTATGGRRFALPLDAVARLEEFPADRVERAAETEIAQYRGDLLPLVRLRERFGLGGEEPARALHVVVCGSGPDAAGFVVDEVLDIVEESAELRRAGAGRGLAGAVVIQGKTADVLDVAQLAREAAAR